MTEPTDKPFFDRADAHIALSMVQLKTADGPGVAASALFAAARFNVWMCANIDKSATRMAERRQDAERAFVDEYRRIFLENYDDYIHNWDKYNWAEPKQE